MTDYEYDEKLPYVVVGAVTGRVSARFWSGVDAEVYAYGHAYLEVIDTTPKPRVPKDARIITWMSAGYRRYAARVNGTIWMDSKRAERHLEDLPGVTPDTVFTVLDERKTND